MVRVGGGWDTLQNYLDKHDPCRCRRGRYLNLIFISSGKLVKAFTTYKQIKKTDITTIYL